ncbi:MAG: outer membrane protein assembly factor BamD [Acidobacteria bacterium]|nr:outer membrane protein assembly factor BamD [Acidobacteriota bacterium]
MRLLYLPIVLLAVSPFSYGQSQKDQLRELQRDVALLQDSVRVLQSSFDQKTAALTILVQQALDNVNRVNTSIAIMNAALGDQEKKVAAPVAIVGQKVDSMAEEFRFVRESITDLNSRMSKLQAGLTDTLNTMKTLQAPPPAPTAVPGGAPGGAPGAPPPGMSAQTTYENALRDMSSGNAELAMQGFSDYLRYFPTTDYAPNAQFYIGQIYYQKQDFENAIKAFDTVLVQYSENNKTPDAGYMKGMALLKSGLRSAAYKEFKAVVTKYPSSDVAGKARQEIKKLGLPVPAASSGAARRRGRR